ncbi:DUF308 domain-containing protein [Nocardioides sp. CER19]|uniref:HdeD family acid-resistance protein n=1 Tax=Nocardioides sp. CER19 TaxID=3038538 RepID=UPI0024487DCA|nr:DUF308 domain-containing protein [Nocardioides sp. CER19]MDH2416010.1 DUF308 domain-containing protein [Nocardioides sp. CER19]
MSDEQYAGFDGPEGRPTGLPTAISVLADHWGLVMAYGLVSLGLGITLAVWPDETLTVVAVLIGVQFLVSGVVRIIGALASSGLDTSLRLVLGLTGAIALIVGLLCLRDPLQTLLAITLILGVWWLVSGVIDLVRAVVAPVPERRAWDLFSGGISVLAGGFLLVDPHLSLGVLVFVTSVWLILTGLLGVVAALRLRARRSRESTGTTSASPPPAPAL